MPEAEATIWGIHAGKTGDADSLFLKKHHIAIGWVKVGDRSKIRAGREAFKAKVIESYPDKKPEQFPLMLDNFSALSMK